MANLCVTGLRKRFGGKLGTQAIDGLDLEIHDGEFLVLLGPSGCGKTTTLRCVAGLDTPDGGQIISGDRVWFDVNRRLNLPPNKRNLGMVFQSYSLWPHMTVAKNIGFPLRRQRIRGIQARESIREAAKLVNCEDLLDRHPSQLSGGQQQRVSLARALVGRPDLILFDEPLSNLDAQLRDLVRSQIHELHQRLGFTAIFVTHDQTEALALGQRLAIMRAGALEQLGKPDEIFESPVSEYVAAFMGMSNRLSLVRAGGQWMHEEVPIRGQCARALVEGAGTEMVIRLRPEDTSIRSANTVDVPGDAVLTGTVTDVEYGGRHIDVTVLIGGSRVRSKVSTAATGGWIRGLAAGDRVCVYFNYSEAGVFDRAGNRVDLRETTDRKWVGV